MLDWYVDNWRENSLESISECTLYDMAFMMFDTTQFMMFESAHFSFFIDQLKGLFHSPIQGTFP